ncbi:MAG: hypothetical protein ABSH22_08115 [Tepidisphaeraceae bacterium]|jgi:hypothetical protein
MKLNRDAQMRLHGAIAAIVHFLLIRIVGETMASGVMKMARAWARLTKDKQNSTND